jgi:hypothetical protein
MKGRNFFEFRPFLLVFAPKGGKQILTFFCADRTFFCAKVNWGMAGAATTGAFGLVEKVISTLSNYVALFSAWTVVIIFFSRHLPKLSDDLP